MKAYKVELLVLDFEDDGADSIVTQLTNQKHLCTTVIDIEGKEIGEWSDDHPLNSHLTLHGEFEKLFG